MSAFQAVWSSRASTETASTLVLRAAHSSLSWATRPSSVVHTGVKSAGWLNSTAQPSPFQSWKVSSPSVVWAVKSGASSPSRRVAMTVLSKVTRCLSRPNMPLSARGVDVLSGCWYAGERRDGVRDRLHRRPARAGRRSGRRPARSPRCRGQPGLGDPLGGCRGPRAGPADHAPPRTGGPGTAGCARRSASRGRSSGRPSRRGRTPASSSSASARVPRPGRAAGMP